MTATWSLDLDRAIDHRFGQMVEIRRRLHTYPEVSGAEHETSLYLYQVLGNGGYEVRQGPEGRGVIADSSGDGGAAADSRLGLRADIDALRIQDQKDVPYRSQREGVMHACGHDAHTAILAGTLLAIHDVGQSGKLPWPVRLRGVFQPAEETGEGALEMIQAGALEGVDAILALHVDPTLPAGQLGLRDGVFTANCDDMQISIVGRGGHAARPHEASDPITAAAQLINSLYLHIPRATDSRDAVVITIGKIVGGDNANVIPEHVELCGTIRTLDEKIRRQTLDHIRRLAAGVSLSSETKIEVAFGMGAKSIRNDTTLVKLLRQAGREVVGRDGLIEIDRASMGSEDFSFFLESIPGAMVRLGCAPAQAATGHGLHTPLFDVDEEALRVGARVLTRAAVAWSDPSRRRPRREGPRAAGVPT
jgi:amidohydrolase